MRRDLGFENKIRFFVQHRGFSFPCVAWLRNELQIFAVALDNASPGSGSVPRVLREGQEPSLSCADSWREAREQVSAKLDVITDFLSAGLDWRAAVTCRRSPNLIGTIIEAAEARRIAAVRPWQRPKEFSAQPPHSGGAGTLGGASEN